MVRIKKWLTTLIVNEVKYIIDPTSTFTSIERQELKKIRVSGVPERIGDEDSEKAELILYEKK